MQSMDADGPGQLQGKAGYQGYGGQQGYRRQGQQQSDPFGPAGQAPQGAIDDDFVDAIAARIAQQFNQGKIYGRSRSRVSPAQKVAVAIVSVVMLIPLAAITLGILQAVGIIAFIIACVAIALINIAFAFS